MGSHSAARADMLLSSCHTATVLQLSACSSPEHVTISETNDGKHAGENWLSPNGCQRKQSC